LSWHASFLCSSWYILDEQDYFVVVIVQYYFVDCLWIWIIRGFPPIFYYGWWCMGAGGCMRIAFDPRKIIELRKRLQQSILNSKLSIRSIWNRIYILLMQISPCDWYRMQETGGQRNSASEKRIIQLQGS
jgi:hypothetical protein